MYNGGISREGNILDVGVREEIVQKSGAWFSYNEIRLGQGRENAKQYFKDNPSVAIEVENKIREKYNLPLGENKVVKIPEEIIAEEIEVSKKVKKQHEINS